MRQTVDLETFAHWRSLTPGLLLPQDFDVVTTAPAPSAGPVGSAGPAGTTGSMGSAGPRMPAFVAASFAVHAGAEAMVGLVTRDRSTTVRLAVSIAEGLSAVLVRAASSVEGGWVQVALLPARQAPGEVALWVPDVADNEVLGPSALVVTVAAPVSDAAFDADAAADVAADEAAAAADVTIATFAEIWASDGGPWQRVPAPSLLPLPGDDKSGDDESGDVDAALLERRLAVALRRVLDGADDAGPDLTGGPDGH